jgi:nicotinate-nucleotide adenylyltransferase
VSGSRDASSGSEAERCRTSCWTSIPPGDRRNGQTCSVAPLFRDAFTTYTESLRIAIFGGTFDPIHDAHLAVAREAASRCRLDRVLMIPAAQPPHKKNIERTPFVHRYRMVELACAGDPVLTPSRLEEGERKSYSIDTIERIPLAAGDSLHFIIGADAFAEIQTWHRWRDVVARVEFIVVSRPGHDYEIPPGSRIHRLDTMHLATSSTAIREQLAQGARPAGLPDLVWNYIRTQGLYTLNR